MRPKKGKEKLNSAVVVVLRKICKLFAFVCKRIGTVVPPSSILQCTIMVISAVSTIFIFNTKRLFSKGKKNLFLLVIYYSE